MMEYQHDQEVALFKPSEIEVGKRLGSGAFSNVFELKALHADEDTASTQRITENVKNSPKGSPYAVKILKPDLAFRPQLVRAASRDLKQEANVLLRVNHPNIISIQGYSTALHAGTSPEKTDQHFLIMDRLDETLSVRLEQWQLEATRLETGIAARLGLSRRKKKQLLVERLNVATEIASALEYLHQNRMIYRDLKAGNVGFDATTGQVKLFDFGSTRALPKDMHKKETRRMSRAGTYRSMAPEVALKLPYNESADVYSFSHLLWRIIALEPAYEGYSRRGHRARVVLGGERPPIDSRWPTAIQELLKSSWSAEITERPSMTQVIAVLKREIANLIGKKEASAKKDVVLCESETLCSHESCPIHSCDSMDSSVSSSKSLIGSRARKIIKGRLLKKWIM